ncbi:MAG: hypothetical protein ACK5G9_12050 [Akkermansiaceae bacterium]
MSEKSELKKLIDNVVIRNDSALTDIINKSYLSSIELAALIISDAVDHFLEREEFANAYYLLGVDCVSKLEHPSIDYSRVVTLSFCDKHADAVQLLKSSNEKYPMDESLNNLRDFFKTGLDVRYLFC